MDNTLARLNPLNQEILFLNTVLIYCTEFKSCISQNIFLNRLCFCKFYFGLLKGFKMKIIKFIKGFENTGNNMLILVD